jgi:hypothetical protein
MLRGDLKQNITSDSHIKYQSEFKENLFIPNRRTDRIQHDLIQNINVTRTPFKSLEDAFVILLLIDFQRSYCVRLSLVLEQVMRNTQ